MAMTLDGSAGVTTNAGGSVNPSTNVEGINYSCRAWVNFDGTKDTTGATSTANTNRLIRGSGNVASVLRNGTGDYTITFTTAMTDANYAINAISSTTTGVGATFTTVKEANQGGTNPSTTVFRLSTRNSTFADIDLPYTFASVFR